MRSKTAAGPQEQPLHLLSVLLLVALTATAASGQFVDCSDPADCEAAARDWLDNVYEVEHRALDEAAVQADWVYNTNINQENSDASNDAFAEVAAYDKQAWTFYVNEFDQSTFSDEDIKRRLDLMQTLGPAALPDDRFQELTSVVTDMNSIYGSAKVCPFDNQNCDLESEGLTLEPDLEAILADTPNRSWEELSYVWKAWRDASGKLMRDSFIEYIDIYNEAAEANNLNNAKDLWLIPYTADLDDGDDFTADLEELWQVMKPLYQKLHGYVRYKYRQHWGSTLMPNEMDPIPAHLSGNMWAQQWQGTYEMVAPYPDVENPLDGVDDILADYTVREIFELSNSFYLSLGLADMEMCFDTPCSTENTPENVACIQDNPMIEKPDWDVVCHASAWDMYHVGLDDYRIKMCAETNLEDLVTVHHEMGHIEYFIQYKDKPLQFRDGANPGFHEAIGDTMALAVQTPDHLYSIGLLPEVVPSPEADINYLMNQAMERVMFLPFAYTIDQYRWALFNGTFTTDEMTARWWQLREQYQGINPPVMRDETDFDPGAKYHVAASVPYIRYFVAHILEYQFYKQMCLDSQQYDPNDVSKPLYLCDFSAGDHAIDAGTRMKEMLQAGSSKPWPDTLEAMTGSRKMDASAVLEYFKPLSDWLDGEIAANSIPVGWDSTYSNWIN